MDLRKVRWGVACVAAIIIAVVIGLGRSVKAAPPSPTVSIVVNNGGDTNVRDSYLTLREAILIARDELTCVTDAEKGQISGVKWGSASGCSYNYISSGVGGAWITFNSAMTVSPTSALPQLPCNTWLSSASDSTRNVVIDGSLTTNVDGLQTICDVAGGSNIAIQYLTIQNYDWSGIYATGVQTATLKGLSIHNNGGAGIYLAYSALRNPRGNQIGTSSASDRNYIYSNFGDGIRIDGNSSFDSAAQNNKIENTSIGLDTSGQAAGNTLNGIRLTNAWNNTIGGSSSSQRNVISSNSLDGIKIYGNSHAANQVSNNYIGTDSGGTTGRGNSGSGVNIGNGSGYNVIGGAGAGNVIAANADGITLAGSGTSSNTVYGNYIGTNVSSSTTLGNKNAGVKISGGASGNLIGGSTAGWGNVISGNTSFGIQIQDTGTSANQVASNVVGTDVTGSSAVPNGVGIQIVSGAQNNIIGATGSTRSNVISGNSSTGVILDGSSTANNSLYSNYIGTNVTGTVALANGGSGVLIRNGAHNNTIGDSTNGNLISGNGHSGIWLEGSGTSQNALYSNTVGLNGNRTGKIPNGWSGIGLATGASNNIIGGGGKGNTISGNGDAGIDIMNSGTNSNQVCANAIGTNPGWSTNLGNVTAGVRIRDGAQSNVVGCGGTGNRNTISGNGGAGVEIKDSGTTNNNVYNNLIGTNGDGTSALPNITGVAVKGGAASNNIGYGLGNLISGNSGPGIAVYDSGTTSNTIQLNYIGTNLAGTSSISNTAQGVLVQGIASSNVITRNVISGNGSDGIGIMGAGTTANLVDSNYIGLNAAGTASIPNGSMGINVDGADGNVIGSSGSVTQFISGNAMYGIWVRSANGTQILSSNAVGVGANQTSPIGNAHIGIQLDAANNSLVLPAIVANNGDAGIGIEEITVGNRALPGTVKNNGGLAIDLENDGFTPNDPGDTDIGANTKLNYPVITGVSGNTVSGSACASCYVYVYQAIGNPAASGGGGTLESHVQANSSGVWQWTLPSGLMTGQLTLVACQQPCNTSGGNTSEMSPLWVSPVSSKLFLPLVTKGYAPPPPPALPTPPGPLTVTVLSPTSLTVAWNDNSTNEDGFYLERSVNGGGFSALPTVSSSTGTGVIVNTFSGLSPNTTYGYRVRVHNSAGYSSYSNSGSGKTPSNLTLPAAPSGLTVTGLYPDMTELSWTNNANNATEFGIDLSTDHGASWWTGANGGTPYGVVSSDFTTVWDNERVPNTEYCYRVRAQNAAGNSAWTSMACATTPPLPSVNAPSNLNAVQGSGTNVTLTWNDNSNNEDGFTIETSYNGGAYNAYINPVTMQPGSTSVTIAEPTAGATYKFHIRAFNSYATSAWSNEKIITLSSGALTGARFTNNTSYSVVSLKVDGTERLTQSAAGAIAPGGSLQLNLAAGSHTYSAITGYYSGSYRNDMWHYPGGGGTLSLNVTSGSVAAVPAIANPTIQQLLANPLGGRTSSIWMAQTGQPYVNVCFEFRNDGTFRYRGNTSGTWTGYSTYSLISYPGNLYVTFQPNGFPYGRLSEVSITQSFPSPTFTMPLGPGGTNYLFEYSFTNTCY